MVVHPSFPTKTIPEFIAYAKSNPGKINMGSGTPGAAIAYIRRAFQNDGWYRHGARSLSWRRAGSDRSARADKCRSAFATMPASIEHIRAGRLRALAVTTATRSDALPDIPTVGEFVPGYEASDWYGLGVPKDTPAEIIDQLNKEINAALDDPKMKARLADLGGTPLPGSPARVRQADRRRNREMGQGDPRRQHQTAGMKSRPKGSGRLSINSVWRTAAKTAVGTFLPCQPRRAMSGFRGKAAVPQKSRDGRG